MADDGRDQIVTVGEDIRLSQNGVSDDPFGGKAPLIYCRRHTLDDDSATTVELHNAVSRCEVHALGFMGRRRLGGEMYRGHSCPQTPPRRRRPIENAHEETVATQSRTFVTRSARSNGFGRSANG